MEGDQHIADHDGSAELFSQNSDGGFVPDTDVTDAQQQVDPDGVSKIDETDFDEQSGDTLKVTGESTLEDTKDKQSGDTSKVTGESTLEDTKDKQSGDTTVNPGEVDTDKHTGGDAENSKKKQ